MGSVEQQLVPRGGPIYLSDLVGPITRVPEFETSIIQELQSLINELKTAESCDEDDLLVDELKVFSEEELVGKALKEAFEVEIDAQCSTQVQQQQITTASNGNTVEGDKLEKTTSDRATRAARRLAKSQVQGSNISAMNPCSSGTTVEIDGGDKLEKTAKKRQKGRRAFDRETQAAQLEKSKGALEVQTQLETIEIRPQVQESSTQRMNECSNGTIVERDGEEKSEKTAKKRQRRWRVAQLEKSKEAFHVETQVETTGSQPEVQESNISVTNGTIVERDGEDKLQNTSKKRQKQGSTSDRVTRASRRGKNKEVVEVEAQEDPHQVQEVVPYEATESTIGCLESNILALNECSDGTIVEMNCEDKLEKTTKNRQKQGRNFDRVTRASQRVKNKEVIVVETQTEMENQTHVQEMVPEAATKNTTTVGLESNNLASTTKRRKRGRTFDRETRASQLENASYIEKVEKLAKIKQKQDEDKLAARLHSFNGGCKVGEGALTLSRADQVKMRTLNFITSSVKTRRPPVVGHVAILYPEVVLCVEIWNMAKTVKSQEFLVLGSQMLSVLRDQIYCSTDQLMQKAGKHDPSGYFLIEDVFCNDKRDPSAIDYSEPIFEWLRKSKDEVQQKWETIVCGAIQHKRKPFFGTTSALHTPQFKAVEMHKIRFCDLWFRLGAGYLYCHQGDCKHFVVIRDMRLIHPEDIWNRAAYPVITFQHKPRYRKCSVCKIYRATKVTVDDKWAQENPCHFCDNCYYLLHYQQDGSLLYPDFTVHDYHHE